MVDRIMRIYYGSDRLPYKDEERVTHYPIASGDVFVGENNATSIKFFVDKIGGGLLTWLATIKLPNGSLVTRLMPSVSADGSVTLDISRVYTSGAGSIYVTLTGYNGNDVQIEQDEDENYIITGDPYVITTGACKVNVNYTPQVLYGENFEPSDKQQILAYLAVKLDIQDGIVFYNNIQSIGNDEVPTSALRNGQLVFDNTTKAFYSFNSTTTTFTKTQIDIENVLNANQINAVNSGITSGKVASYDSHIANNDIHVTTQNKSYWNAKQEQVVGGNLVTIGADGKTINVNPIWGSIGGTLSNQTDLNNKFNDVYAKIDGKTISFVISKATTYNDVKSLAQDNKSVIIFDYDGTYSDKKVEVARGDYDNTMLIANSSFDSTTSEITITNPSGKTNYLAQLENDAYILFPIGTSSDATPKKVIKLGASVFVKESNIPDRWVSDIGQTTYKFQELETKADLSNYYTKAETNAFLNNKQDKLTFAQQDAVDSGITDEKVDSYDEHISDNDIHVTSSDKTNWNNKQNALTFNTQETPTATLSTLKNGNDVYRVAPSSNVVNSQSNNTTLISGKSVPELTTSQVTSILGYFSNNESATIKSTTNNYYVVKRVANSTIYVDFENYYVVSYKIENNEVTMVAYKSVSNDDYAELSNIANGKNKAFVISCQLNIATIKQNLSTYSLARAYLIKNWNGRFNNFSTENCIDITQRVISGEFDTKVINTNFNTTDNSVTINYGQVNYLVSNIANQTYIFYPIIDPETHESSGVKSQLDVGDSILIRETNVPDRWCDYVWTDISFLAYDSKVDLANYYTKTEIDNTFATITYVDESVTGFITQSELEDELENYYTKTESNTLLDAKQNALTSGDGINISNNVISVDKQVSGDFPNLKAGGLTSTTPYTDTTAYSFTETANGADINGAKGKKVAYVGGKCVKYNQLFNKAVFPATTTINGITFTNNGDGTITCNGTATGQASLRVTNLTLDGGHKFFYAGCPAGGSDNTYVLYSNYYDFRNYGQDKIFISGRLGTTITPGIFIRVFEGTTVSNLTFKPQVIDLTDAGLDSITTVEQFYATDVGKLLQAQGYLSYTTGAVAETSITAMESTGFNQYDHSVGYARVIGGKAYYIGGTYTSLKFSTTTTGGETITPNASNLYTPSQNGYIIVEGGNGTDTIINLHHSGTRDGQYEAYKKNTYPITFAGYSVPSLVSPENDVYDELKPDGTYIHRVGKIDLGTLRWFAYGAETPTTFYAELILKPRSSTAQLLCSLYTPTIAYGAQNMPNMYMRDSGTRYVYFRNDNYTDVETFKTAMSGVYLYYVLETPTTEQGTPFDEYQLCDDWGTMGFTYANGYLPVPVNHSTTYETNYYDYIKRSYLHTHGNPNNLALKSDLESKQDVLTAGSNIQINNNVISATDTTYTGGTGIDITSNEIKSVGVEMKVGTTTPGLVELTFIRCTQQEYDALTTKEPNTLYIILG